MPFKRSLPSLNPPCLTPSNRPFLTLIFFWTFPPFRNKNFFQGIAPLNLELPPASFSRFALGVATGPSFTFCAGTHLAQVLVPEGPKFAGHFPLTSTTHFSPLSFFPSSPLPQPFPLPFLSHPPRFSSPKLNREDMDLFPPPHPPLPPPPPHIQIFFVF